MKWISSLSQSESAETAVQECLAALQKGLGRKKPDFAVLFVSPHFEKDYRKIHKMVLDRFGPAVLGCSAGGIIGAGHEVENHPAVSLSAALLPGVNLHPFQVQDADIPDLDAGPKSWHKLLGLDPAENPQFILLADPFSIRVDNFILGLDYAYPDSVKVGGLASGAQAPGKNALYLDEAFLQSGLVGVALTGDVRLDALVAQGCRPIGRRMRVTACDQNILTGLDGQLPLAALQEIHESLDERDRELLQTSLFLGIATDPSKKELGRGDFLIRNILALDAKQGILAVGSLLRPGQTVQFHLRDARTSHEDLEEVLSRYHARPGSPPQEDSSKGVLLFSCLGRGAYLYNEADHDSNLFREKIGPWPISGFFCNGEIGPVGRTTYVHGYTSCFGILSAKSAG